MKRRRYTIEEQYERFKGQLEKAMKIDGYLAKDIPSYQKFVNDLAAKRNTYKEKGYKSKNIIRDMVNDYRYSKTKDQVKGFEQLISDFANEYNIDVKDIKFDVKSFRKSWDIDFGTILGNESLGGQFYDYLSATYHEYKDMGYSGKLAALMIAKMYFGS